MEMSPDIKDLATALAAAQGEFKAPPKDKTVTISATRTYNYADIATIIDVVKPVMAKHGLSISQMPSVTEKGFDLVTILMHTSGQWLKSSMPLPDNAKPQDLGSYLTYFRRYSLSSVLGIAADEDEDGKIAQDNKSPAKPSPVLTKATIPVQPTIRAVEPRGDAFEGDDFDQSEIYYCDVCSSKLVLSKKGDMLYCQNYKDESKGKHTVKKV